MQIFKRFQFEAAHYLPKVAENHKCRRLHGHSFQVEITIDGPLDPSLGWVCDFSQIKAHFQPIYDQLDHCLLNDVPGLENPTSEHIAIWIWKRLKPHLPELHQIEIHETCNSGCRYRGS